MQDTIDKWSLDILKILFYRSSVFFIVAAVRI